MYNSFEGEYLTTIGTDIHVKTVDVEDVRIKLVIWDIGGQKDFEQLRRAYYQNAAGAFFVFDTTRPETLDRIHQWISVLYEVTGTIPLVLVENKIDLDSKIKPGYAEEIAKKFNCVYVRTSAKEDMNVEEAFLTLSRQILTQAREKFTMV